ncbi:hypothetical protein IR083_19385 [Dysgonomonas sp. GY75]|uniref:hypothetical protein n=1 Tax=Dysgonomonas sp. GY75 TaxID=2780419 RepID=UPI001883911E|nr:hypothetical protein [Dysgonomonas sp. GY75]MBF0650985.1 hypothetical protein [Dysgonomonas sp. GY75]
MNEDKDNIGKEFNDILKSILNNRKINVQKNIKRSFAVDTITTYYDLKSKYTEEEARKILKEEFKLSPKALEEELDIIYHKPDTDLSLPILYYTSKERKSKENDD